MNRRGIIASAIAGVTGLTPALTSAAQQRRRRKRYTRPDGTICWHRSLVEVGMTWAGATPPHDTGFIGIVYLKKRRATVGQTNAGDTIFLDGDDVCVQRR